MKRFLKDGAITLCAAGFIWSGWHHWTGDHDKPMGPDPAAKSMIVKDHGDHWHCQYGLEWDKDVYDKHLDPLRHDHANPDEYDHWHDANGDRIEGPPPTADQ